MLPLRSNSSTTGSPLAELAEQTAVLQAQVTLQRGTWVKPAPAPASPLSMYHTRSQVYSKVSCTPSIPATLTSGTSAQRSDAWGKPHEALATRGASLRATFPEGLPQPYLARQWRRLAHGLGALTGASLGLLVTPERVLGFTSSRAGRPGKQAEGRGAWWTPDSHGAVWLQGTLPTEPLCTENLAGFVRMLPCGTASGLASLLRSPQLLAGAPYLSMRLRLAPGYARLSLKAVLPVRGGGSRAASHREWDMARSLHAHIHGPCPCMAASAVRIQLQPMAPLSRGAAAFQSVSAWPRPPGHQAGGGQPLLFDLLAPGDQRAAAARCPMLPTVRWHEPAAGIAPTPGGAKAAALSVYTHARVRGLMASISMHLSLPAGGEGALAGSAGNASAQARACFVLQQGLPWWLQLWTHTLRLSTTAKQACTPCSRSPEAPLLPSYCAINEQLGAQHRPVSIGPGALLCTCGRQKRTQHSVGWSATCQSLPRVRGLAWCCRCRAEWPSWQCQSTRLQCIMAPCCHRPCCRCPANLFAHLSVMALNAASAQEHSLQGAVPATAYGEAVLLRRPLADASMPYNALCLTLSVAVLHVAALASALLR